MALDPPEQGAGKFMKLSAALREKLDRIADNATVETLRDYLNYQQTLLNPANVLSIRLHFFGLKQVLNGKALPFSSSTYLRYLIRVYVIVSNKNHNSFKMCIRNY
jgi:hypothetical protein